MRWLLSFSIILLLPTEGMCFGSVQEDWSGGPGLPGPVTYWNESFSECGMASWSGVGGYLLLDFVPEVYWIDTTGTGCTESVITDLDDDGDLDILGCNYMGEWVGLWINVDGSGDEWAWSFIADSLNWPESCCTSDIDGDGDPDLVASTSDGPMWFENCGTSEWVPYVVDSTEGCDNIRADDIDGDGDADIACCGNYPSITRWYENLDGVGGSWGYNTVSSTYNYACIIRIADLDMDGDNDIVIGKGSVPRIVYFENEDGQGNSWTPHVVSDEVHNGDQGFAFHGLEVFDLDDDGDNDVLAAACDPYTETGMVVWVENIDGIGLTWTRRAIDYNLSGAYTVDAADLDSDGDLDVMATSGVEWSEDLLAWYENVTGDALNWNRHELADTCSFDVIGCDLDGDDNLDVVAVNSMLMRWYSFSRATSGWLESSILDPPGGSQEQWTDLTWESTTPAGTGLTFQVRASNDPADMGEWSPEMVAPGSLGPYLPDPTWYFQYRVNLTTAVPPLTPVLDKVTVLYDLMGAPGGGEPPEPSLTVLSGNPSPGIVTLDVYMSEVGQADLRIFDIAGRVAAYPLSGQIAAGHHELTVTDLPTGCYRAVMTTDALSIEEVVTVLR